MTETEITDFTISVNAIPEMELNNEFTANFDDLMKDDFDIDYRKAKLRGGPCAATTTTSNISDPLFGQSEESEVNEVQICTEGTILELPFTPPVISDPGCSDSSNYWLPMVE